MASKGETARTLAPQAQKVLEAFDTRTSVYLDSKGEWRESPRALEECASHEILFQCWRLNDSPPTACFQDLSACLTQAFGMDELEKICLALDKGTDTDPCEQSPPSAADGRPFLTIFRILAWCMAAEAMRINSRRKVPEWNRAAQAECRAYGDRLQRLNAQAGKCFTAPVTAPMLPDLYHRLVPALPDPFVALPALLAEEDRLAGSIEGLLATAKDQNREEEMYALIIQKLHPPTGVVSEISQAWLRPCMRLLLDDSLNVSSGIPYAAAVVLSVLQDIRSTKSLLKALDLFPVRFTKIRENLLYTLGKLGEPHLVPAAGHVLNSPNMLSSQTREEAAWAANLTDQKVEAVQALGRVGLPSLQVLSPLLACASHPSDTVKTHLAWSLGEIGKAQKDELGGVDTGIIITLLKLLSLKNKDSFIESVSALKKMGCPEFLHSLYLYDIGAVSILGIKPAQTGLYELSETLHYLIKSKGRAIMAVNGDSGTGKTYFCEAIQDGFGDVRPEQILYMMRDRKKDQAIFNRILGLEWLEKYIDPVYYEGYPVSQEADDPDGYFLRFLEAQADRKLIILDGCRDRHYFQRIIDRFYQKGLLDVAVNFRAAHSTRRENLEEREMALESIKTHLSFLEEPALEDTLFYQQGNVLIYDLDNSSPHRLLREEIQELFQKSHVDHWGDLILLGDFQSDSLPCRLDLGSPNLERDRFDHESEDIPEAAAWEFSMEERKFQIVLNRDLESQPCFLGHIPLSDIKPKQIGLYAQDQIAGLGETGLAFVLTFVDNRIFYAPVRSSRGLSFLGREMFSIDEQGELLRLSFESGQAARLTSRFPAVTCLDTRLKDTVATGHSDGSLRVWDFARMRISKIAAHDTPIRDLTLDDGGRAYSTGSDGLLKGWDLRHNTQLTVSGMGRTKRTWRYPGGKILVESDALCIFDPENESFQAFSLPMKTEISDISVYPDGRIVAALPGGIGVFAPEKDLCKFSLIKAHAHSTLGCLTLGPKILTCGRESDELYDLRISGTELFVKHESDRLSLQA